MADLYSQEAINSIKATYGAEIARQSALLGVSTGAVAGSMVKEYNSNIATPVQA